MSEYPCFIRCNYSAFYARKCLLSLVDFTKWEKNSSTGKCLEMSFKRNFYSNNIIYLSDTAK